ncbi:MAG: HDOD domain-containing protein [Nitrosomonadales bacterium]|nr:HDOD domain-containing protein [Nitrosomonadales bacterium]
MVNNGIGHIDLKQAINKLDALPAMPAIAQKLLALDLNTEEGEHMLLVLIEQDPLISAKIVGLANSAMIGASRRITTVKDSAMLMGTKRVQSVATSIAIMTMMTKTPATKFSMQDLWLHSLGISFAILGIARFIPEKVRPQEDLIFLAGMLHDIGFMALAYLDPKLSDRLHTCLAAEPERPIVEIEREVLNVCHEELGAELARHWNLPEEIISVIRHHHQPDAAEVSVGRALARMINIAEKLLPHFCISEYGGSSIAVEEWKALGIDPSKANEIKMQVEEGAEEALQFVASAA